ncbi:hypothetical protein CR513_50940, partial [Mucuna pruriens]
MRRFSHSIRLQNRGTERLLQPVQDSRCKRRTAAPNKPELRVNRFRVFQVTFQYDLVHRRNRGIPRGVVPHHVAPERGGGEPPRRWECHGGAGGERTEQRGEQAVDVKQGENDDGGVGLSEFVHGLDVLHRRGQVVLRQRHALGAARGAGGVEE